jgi:RNA polymerase sigma-70 factor, ECF subfamily
MSETSTDRLTMVPASLAPSAEHGDEQHTWIDGVRETPGPSDESFEDGILVHLPILHHVALRLTRRHHDAEDLVQETVARALAHQAQFQRGTNLCAWLLTIERSIFLNAHRRMRQAPPLQSMDAVDESTLYGTGAMHSSPSAEHVLLHGRIDDAIVEALRTLPAHYRVAVLLCDVQGLSYAEIAQQMGCALGTVMSRVHRGRALLRQMLARPGSASDAPVELPPAPEPITAVA